MITVLLKNMGQIIFKLFFKESPVINSGWPLLERSSKTDRLSLITTYKQSQAVTLSSVWKEVPKSATVNAQLHRRGKRAALECLILVSAGLKIMLRYENYPSGPISFMFAKDCFGTCKKLRVLVVIMYFLFTDWHKGKPLHTSLSLHCKGTRFWWQRYVSLQGS